MLRSHSEIPVAVLVAILASAAQSRSGAGGEEAARGWPRHGGDSGHTQYSPLDQIDTSNVHRLAVAWTHRTGDARDDGRSEIQCNPIVVDGVLYATSARLSAFALDAATGRELCRFDPFAAEAGAQSVGVNRGVATWPRRRRGRSTATC